MLQEEIIQEKEGKYLELRSNRGTWDKEFKDFRDFVEIQAKKGVFDTYPAILVITNSLLSHNIFPKVVPPGARQDTDPDTKLNLSKKDY